MKDKIKTWKGPEEIAQRVKEVAVKIEKDYKGSELYVMGILRSSFIFMADLVRAMSIPVRCQFINIFYKHRENNDNFREIEETTIYPAHNLEGKNVLIVTTVVDTGIVVDHVKNRILLKGPSSVKVAALINKPILRHVDFIPDYVAFESMDEDFIFGYGLDLDEKYRNLPYLAKLKQ